MGKYRITSKNTHVFCTTSEPAISYCRENPRPGETSAFFNFDFVTDLFCFLPPVKWVACCYCAVAKERPTKLVNIRVYDPTMLRMVVTYYEYLMPVATGDHLACVLAGAQLCLYA